MLSSLWYDFHPNPAALNRSSAISRVLLLGRVDMGIRDTRASRRALRLAIHREDVHSLPSSGESPWKTGRQLRQRDERRVTPQTDYCQK